jgi:hypothetical protein
MLGIKDGIESSYTMKNSNFECPDFWEQVMGKNITFGIRFNFDYKLK